MGRFRLLEQGRYTFNEAQGQGGGDNGTDCPEGITGMDGLVTKCEYFGIVFYVKEYYAPCGSFHTSSAHRWGLKIGKSEIKRDDPGCILHLICPTLYFDFLAPVITALDPLKRRVVKTTCRPDQAQRHINKEPNKLFNPITLKI